MAFWAKPANPKRNGKENGKFETLNERNFWNLATPLQPAIQPRCQSQLISCTQPL